MMRKNNLPVTDYIVYTDGGCAVNPGGPGGIGVVIIDTQSSETEEISQGYSATTNNRMEIRAVLAALRALPSVCSIRLYSDSQYVINCMKGVWEKKKNRDLWKLIAEAEKGKVLDLCWVRGHNGDMYNERCDELATMAIANPAGYDTDTGYLSGAAWGRTSRGTENNTKSPSTGGAMAVKIIIRDDFADTKPKYLDPKEYAVRYEINEVCARAINIFYREGNKSFRAYMALKTGGLDKISRLKEENLLQKLQDGEAAIEIIREHLQDEKDVLTALRWHARGLTVGDSIRKVLVDREVRENCRH